jgi:hypothetical protein
MKRSSGAPYRFASLSTLLGLFALVGSASVSAQRAPPIAPTAERGDGRRCRSVRSSGTADGARGAPDGTNPVNGPGARLPAAAGRAAGVPAASAVRAAGLSAALRPAGPKLGLRVAASSVKSSGEEVTVTGSGGVAGLNLGVFGQVIQSTAVGALLSLDVRSISTVDICITPAGGPKTCMADDNPGSEKDKTFAFNAARLF